MNHLFLASCVRLKNDGKGFVPDKERLFYTDPKTIMAQE